MEPADGMQVTVTRNGPDLVEGSVPLSRESIESDAGGDSVGWTPGERFEDRATYALCRCGHSAAKPYCDGSHARVDFDGTETADRSPYLDRASGQQGPTLSLTDDQSLCAFARYCDVAGQVWNLVEQDGPEAARLTALEASLCPSGRLVAWDNTTGQAIEPELEPSIGHRRRPGRGARRSHLGVRGDRRHRRRRGRPTRYGTG